MATGMTRGGALLRYGAAAVVLIAAELAGSWFHSAGMYRGAANIPLAEFPEDVDVLSVLTFAPTIVGLKYLAYDFAVQAFTKTYRTLPLLLCFFAGYAAALAIDAACLFSASTPIADAGLAVMGAVFQTPLVLFACAAAIAATVLLKDRPPQTGASTP